MRSICKICFLIFSFNLLAGAEEQRTAANQAYAQGLEAERLGDRESALRFYNQAFQLNPQHENARDGRDALSEDGILRRIGFSILQLLRHPGLSLGKYRLALPLPRPMAVAEDLDYFADADTEGEEPLERYNSRPDLETSIGFLQNVFPGGEIGARRRIVRAFNLNLSRLGYGVQIIEQARPNRRGRTVFSVNVGISTDPRDTELAARLNGVLAEVGQRRARLE